MFSNLPIKIYKRFIEVQEIKLFTGNSVDYYLNQFKSEICIKCLTCHTDTTLINRRKYRLPCGCIIFNEECLNDYLKYCFNNYKKTQGNVKH